MKLYVGTLSFNTTESQLRDLFAAHGEVVSASLILIGEPTVRMVPSIGCSRLTTRFCART